MWPRKDPMRLYAALFLTLISSIMFLYVSLSEVTLATRISSANSELSLRKVGLPPVSMVVKLGH